MLRGNSKKKKLIYLEVMRIIAAFFVIFNHSDGFTLFMDQQLGSPSYWIYLIISICSKFAVPVFFMISGALLLARDEPIKVVLKKRVLPIIVILLVFSFGYYIVEVIRGTQSAFSLKIFFFNLYSTGWNYSFWYLYAYIGFLLLLPFLRPMVQNMKTSAFYYLIALVIIFEGILPILQYLITNNEYSLNSDLGISRFIAWPILYPCLGYFFEHRVTLSHNRVTRRNLIVLAVISLIGIIISAIMTYICMRRANYTNNYDVQIFFNSFIIIYSITIYLSLKYIFEKHQFRHIIIERIILSVGSTALGIYILHVLFLARLTFMWKFYYYLVDDLGINHMLCALFICFLVMLICYAITTICHKIPILRRLL